MKNPFWIILIFAGLLSVVLMLPDDNLIYHYKGYSELPIDSALSIISEYADDTTIVAYAPNDKIYITYDFWASTPTLYGIRGEKDSFRYYATLVVLILSAVLVIGGAVGFYFDKRDLWRV